LAITKVRSSLEQKEFDNSAGFVGKVPQIITTVTGRNVVEAKPV